MSYSDFVYRTPGRNHGPNGKTYDWREVKSEDEKDQALKDGWFDTLPEACGLKVEKTVEKKTEEKSENVSRKDLESKAAELGIKVDGRMKDETIAAKIEEALK